MIDITDPIYAEAAPKHGKWEPFDLTWGRSVWACDACGETVDVPTINGKPIFDYCPWCGAKMEMERRMSKAREYDPVTDFPKHWCGNCQLRIYFARHYEIHLDWKNCPYACEYKKEMMELERNEE